MILIAIAGICILTVPLSGGRLVQLAYFPLRWLAAPVVALALQVVVVTIAPDGNQELHAAVHMGTYFLLGLFLFGNRRLPGAPLISAGALTNVLAIVANGGVMPASATAQRLAGLVLRGHGFENSAALIHPHLLWLGDVIPVPGPLPNVLSIGDCMIFIGMLVLLHRTSRQRLIHLSPVTGRTEASNTAAPVGPARVVRRFVTVSGSGPHAWSAAHPPG